MDSQSIQSKVAIFFKQFSGRTFKRGETMIAAGTQPAAVYYLRDGLIRMFAISRKGEESTLTVFKPGSYLPMSWVISGLPNNYFYEAVTPVKVYTAPKERVREFIQQNPDVLYDLLQRLYRGVDGLLERMTHLMATDAYSRLVVELVILGRRFGEERNAEPALSLTVTQKDLAAATGMTRETVSRTLKLLAQKGLLRFSRNQLDIINFQKLEAELLEL